MLGLLKSAMARMWPLSFCFAALQGFQEGLGRQTALQSQLQVQLGTGVHHHHLRLPGAGAGNAGEAANSVVINEGMTSIGFLAVCRAPHPPGGLPVERGGVKITA